MADSITITDQIKEAQKLLHQVKLEIGQAIVGQEGLVKSLLIGVLANGHLLLEGLPGIAKTLAANTLAKVIDCDFKRIQFTPDLLPADLIGTPVYNPKEGSFEVKKGPIFTNILLADEINRSPAKVQSALLEVMQEKQVTIAGQTYPSPYPFMVIATQNPIEQEGTYPLAEAQTDRFMMKVKIDYPSIEEEKLILEKVGTMQMPPEIKRVLTLDAVEQLKKLTDAIYLDERVIDYILTIVQATRHPKKYHVAIEGLLDYGASPRATLALKQTAKANALLDGRYFVTPEDVKQVTPGVLRHRLRLSYEAEAESLTADQIIQRILDTIPTP